MESQQMNRDCRSDNQDLARGGMSLLLWVVPAIILAISAGLGGPYLVVIWPLLLTFMGVACLLNARRCGRLHCFITGPFFLVLAGVSLLYGLGIVPLGAHGWQWLVDTVLIGGCVLTCVPEWLFGKYLRRDQTKAP